MAGAGETEVVRTACPAHCGIDACGILAHVEDGRAVKVEPAEFPDRNLRRICLRGLSSLDVTYHPDRLQHPLRRVGERGEGKFERISWDEALDTVAERFQEIAAKHGWPAVAWVLGGPGSGTTKFGAYLRLASLTQSTRVSAWGYGDSALPCGSRVLFGTHTPHELLRGQPDPKLIIVWGSNPAESVPLNVMRRIMDEKAQGAQLVVIDPRFTVTASKADEYLGVRPGTDAALALGMMHVIFDQGLQDDDFIRKHSVGPYLVRSDTGAFLRGGDLGIEGSKDYVVWDSASCAAQLAGSSDGGSALAGAYTVNGVECKPSFQLLVEEAAAYPPERAAEITGISVELIKKLAEQMATAQPVSIFTHMGFTRTFYGDLSMRALGALATVTGSLRLTAGGGHRPVVLNWKPFLHADTSKPSYSRLGILPFYDAAASGKPFPVKAAYFAFIDFLNLCADSNRIAREVFPKLDFIVMAELFMTPSARYADILLPACSYLEFSDLVLGPYPYVQLQQKAIEPLHEAKSDVDIASELAQRLGFGEQFDKGEEGFVDLLLDSGHPSVDGIDVNRLKQGPAETRRPATVEHGAEVKFSTPSGKIELYSEALRGEGQALPVYLEPLEARAKPADERYPLTYIQGHSRFRTHSMFANVESLLELCPEPVVEIHPRDAKDRSLAEGDRVAVYNDRGRVVLKASVTEGVRPGVVNICQGWWFEQFEEGGFNALTHGTINPVQEKIFEPNMAMNDVAVQVEKV